MKAIHLAIVLFVITLLGCSIGNENSSFEKRRYSSGYHFRGGKVLQANKKLNRSDKKDKRAENHNTSKADGVASLDHLALVADNNSAISENFSENVENSQAAKVMASLAENKIEIIDFYKKEKVVLETDTIKKTIRADVDVKKEARDIKEKYLIAAISGGIGLILFWSFLPFVILGAVGLFFAGAARRKEIKLNEKGVKTDQELLDKIKRRNRYIPTLFLVSSLLLLVGFLVALIAFGAAGTGLFLIGLSLSIVGAFLSLLMLGLSIALLVAVIRKIKEFDDLQTK